MKCKRLAVLIFVLIIVFSLPFSDVIAGVGAVEDAAVIETLKALGFAITGNSVSEDEKKFIEQVYGIAVYDYNLLDSFADEYLPVDSTAEQREKFKESIHNFFVGDITYFSENSDAYADVDGWYVPVDIQEASSSYIKYVLEHNFSDKTYTDSSGTSYDVSVTSPVNNNMDAFYTIYNAYDAADLSLVSDYAPRFNFVENAPVINYLLDPDNFVCALNFVSNNELLLTVACVYPSDGYCNNDSGVLNYTFNGDVCGLKANGYFYFKGASSSGKWWACQSGGGGCIEKKNFLWANRTLYNADGTVFYDAGSAGAPVFNFGDCSIPLRNDNVMTNPNYINDMRQNITNIYGNDLPSDTPVFFDDNGLVIPKPKTYYVHQSTTEAVTEASTEISTEVSTEMSTEISTQPVTDKDTFFNWCNNFFLNFENSIIISLKKVFVPPVSYFDDWFNQFNNVFKSNGLNLDVVNLNFSSVENIINNGSSSDNNINIPDFYIPVLGTDYLICKGEFIFEFMQDLIKILRAFFWFCLFLYDIDQIYFLIRGVHLFRSDK